MAITQLADLTTDQAAYNLMIDEPLRAVLIFDQLASERATRQSMQGSSVIFNISTRTLLPSSMMTRSVMRSTPSTPSTMG